MSEIQGVSASVSEAVYCEVNDIAFELREGVIELQEAVERLAEVFPGWAAKDAEPHSLAKLAASASKRQAIAQLLLLARGEEGVELDLLRATRSWGAHQREVVAAYLEQPWVGEHSVPGKWRPDRATTVGFLTVRKLERSEVARVIAGDFACLPDIAAGESIQARLVELSESANGAANSAARFILQLVWPEENAESFSLSRALRVWSVAEAGVLADWIRDPWLP